jgi:peptidoglycan lytic transglycosylase
MRSLIYSCAVLIAAGSCAFAAAKNANDTVDQTAMAIPRIGIPGAHGVALPQPLSSGDVSLIRNILALQRAGQITEANREIKRIENGLIMGAILADRYINTAYIADAAELSSWLARYGDQPDAPAIRALLDSVTQRRGPPPVEAVAAKPGAKHTNAVAAAPVRTLLVQNHDAAAIRAALAILHGKPPRDQDSLFAGGVASWRQDDTITARPLFEAAWRAARSPRARAAAAFWMARLAHHARDRGGYFFWLRRAARYPDTFYGPIARRALAPSAACLPMPSRRAMVSNADVDALMATIQGRRGFALLQVGERDRAEAEFRALWYDVGPRPGLGRSLVLVANAVGLTKFATELRTEAEAAEAAMGKIELPMLRPAGGFIVDPAFVYAVVRHESNFDPLAVSPVGARGLMQVMPGTAADLGGIGKGETDRLDDPSTNLMIGQRYLVHLGRDPRVGDDLFKVIAAYGEGPSGMNKWAEDVKAHGDPFVFLEAIPSAFMRQFIEDVLVYQWRYAAALRLEPLSLDDLAADTYPRFAPIRALRDGTRARPDACESRGPAAPKG